MWDISLKICVYYVLLQVSERLKLKVFQWLLSLGQQTRLFCTIELPGHILVSHRWRFIFLLLSEKLFWRPFPIVCFKSCTQVKHCELQTLKLWPNWLLTFWSTDKYYWTICMITWAVLAWKLTRWMETDAVHLDTIRCKLLMLKQGICIFYD